MDMVSDCERFAGIRNKLPYSLSVDIADKASFPSRNVEKIQHAINNTIMKKPKEDLNMPTIQDFRTFWAYFGAPVTDNYEGS